MIEDWTIASAGRALRNGTTTAVDLTQQCIDRIDQVDSEIQAFVTVLAESALDQARRADAELRQQIDRGPLHGIPLSLKDLILTQGIRTSAGSAVLADNTPSYSADVAVALTRAGAILLGKTATHEFAWGVFTPPVRNPWNREHIAGGSSGGAAASIIAAEALGGIGTDTGGSVRIPAACCGITGFKPSYGLVSTAGVVTLSDSFDHVGPLARTAEDCALLLDEIVTTPVHPSYAARLDLGVRDINFGILVDFWQTSTTSEIWSLFESAANVLRKNIAVLPSPLEDSSQSFADYRTIQGGEATAYHTRMGWYPERASRYTEITRQRLERGTAITAVDYLEAVRRCNKLKHDWQERFTQTYPTDILLAPTLAIPAPLISATEDPQQQGTLSETLLRLTFPFNLLGVPVLTVPIGFTASGLPVGMQIIGNVGADDVVLRVGHAFQRQTDWHLRQPSLT